ncbi:carbon-nitrogen hydrolase family protein [Paludibaculum fermentans]|uniref:carbon-nitrogen hydrolase family protein n=1 Tax=Paludibaculum fermentans TaxID=1473598 RepID=UPI003EB870F7
MTTFRIALAQLPYPATPATSIDDACRDIAQAAEDGAGLVCFPECYLPGYRGLGHNPPPSDPAFLTAAWARVAAAAASSRIAVILGTERFQDGALLATALVIQPDGTQDGFQDKVQLDPSEDDTYTPGHGRRVFQVGPLTFGIAICHEGWRYPETVRFAIRAGAHIVFHPHLHEAEPGSFVPSSFADPRNTFHEKALLCRAAENTCYVASVNYASPGAPTTSAVVNPDGTLLCHHPYAKAGLLLADLDLTQATGLLAARYRPV